MKNTELEHKGQENTPGNSTPPAEQDDTDEKQRSIQGLG